MKKIILSLSVFGWICCCAPSLWSQVNCTDGSVSGSESFSGQVFFNFGSVNNSYSTKNRTTLTLGEPLTGVYAGQQYNGMLGFYSRFLLPPLAPIVVASQGELMDRIQVNWVIDPLSPDPTLGLNIYRDGIFLGNVGKGVRSYNDFNVIAGRPYVYTISGINEFGEGVAGEAVGFQTPNGVITGRVQTTNNRPVEDVMVTLTPLQGFSAGFEYTDGAFLISDSTKAPILPEAGGSWTITFWIQTDSAASNGAVLQLGGANNLFFRAFNSASGANGIAISATENGAALLEAPFPDSSKNGWHHIALSYNSSGGQGRLYLDGSLVQIQAISNVVDADKLYFGGQNGFGTWAGSFDEFRIYQTILEEIDLSSVIVGTASSLTPGLAHYWKFDEQQGSGSFDIMSQQKIYFCGAAFDVDRPNVRTSAKTNDAGYYRIESVSYGTGTTFLATPSKDFYMYRALRFNKPQSDYVTLPDFSLTPKSTLELWLNSFGPDGQQCVLSKKWGSNEFRVYLTPNGNSNDLGCYFNGDSYIFGALGLGYQHLAISIDSSGGSRNVEVFINGVSMGGHTFTGVSGNGSDTSQTWLVGARMNGSSRTDYFGGLVDEIALYDTLLTQSVIQEHYTTARDAQEKGLRIYFPFNEGNGNRLNNNGSVLLNYGTSYGAEWTTFASRQETMPHIFSPITRQATLNPSVTSVDLVDFADRSTIPVSGYVRYMNTDCFAPQVEILVNGASYSPKIYTDSTGRFVVDLNPGDNVVLSPVFEDHQYLPASWTVTNVLNPLSGILFNDVTTRKVTGQVAGGHCKKSIIKAPPGTGQGTVCTVKIRSADGCLERQITIDNQEGDFEFLEVPPLKGVIVSVVEHSDPNVKAAFQTAGGQTVDLTKRDTAVDFIYYAPPQIVITGFDPVPGCIPETVVLDKGQPVTLEVRVKEQYETTVSDDGVCYLDTAALRFINGISYQLLDTAMTGGLLRYNFKTGEPNPSPPYLKNLQVFATTILGRETSTNQSVVVTGIRNKESTFTTLLPLMPSIILRDPPGDGSFSYIEKGTSVCKTYTTSLSYEVGGGGSLELHLGGDLSGAVGIGVEVDVNLSTTFDIGVEFQVTYEKLTDSTFQTCTEATERISTSEDEMIVGGSQGGDVFMGEAINIVFGLADLVSYNDTICEPEIKTVVNVEPGSFPTVFVYSEDNIKNNVMRYVDILGSSDPDLSPQDSARYAETNARWQDILDRNDSLKEKAKLIRNLSFDASASYEYAETSDTTSSVAIEQSWKTESTLSTTFGFEALGLGFDASINFKAATSNGKSSEDETGVGVTTGYVLADNDPGDAFTLDVAMDSVYKTPVFRLKAGQTQCPWEPGTAHREGTTLEFRDGSGAIVTNVPANEPAVYKFYLGNNSQTNETRTYAFTSDPASNPHGAVIRLNGAYLDHPVGYAIPFGESVPITVTVERGPEKYDYDSLQVAFYSECEDDRANALGLASEDDKIVYSAQFFSAHFIRPCSEVNINVPEQNWVLFPNPNTPGSDDLMRVTVSGYDTSATDFKLVRLQYRRSDGDGAWINVANISDVYNPHWSGFAALPNPKPPILQPGFTQFFWETTGLSDGPYELRAVTVCTGASSDMPGFSEVMKGRIEREPPSLIGTPQPSDGVLQIGDELSFSFNKLINCDHLIPADITHPNNVALYDTETGDLIDIDITCFENKIIIVPNIDNRFIENHLLRAELHDIEDKTGNKGAYYSWEFRVDRNELAWLTDSVGLTKFENETKSMTANIFNRSGSNVPFKIINSVNWVHVVPDTGVLVPNEVRAIRFEVDSSLAIGSWSGVDSMKTILSSSYIRGGSEALKIGARVLCESPDWHFNNGTYENTMNLVLKLNIEGQNSTDIEDMVSAFIGGELRGRSNVQYVPELNTYLVYLTVYGNSDDLLKPIELLVWNAKECLVYASVQETFNFVIDQIIGNPTSPQVIHTNSYILRDIRLGIGWNWVSFNLVFPNDSIQNALATLHHPENAVLKSQSAFSTYLPGNGWVGSLSRLNNISMYNYQSLVADTLKMIGDLIDPQSVSIPVVTGWNWLGYIPNYALPINDALSSLPSQVGDIIKSQEAFAQYIGVPYGWIGNLKYLRAPKGYLLKVQNPGNLVYPVNPNFSEISGSKPDVGSPISNYWNIVPSAFEFSSTFIGMLSVDGLNATTAELELGAFYGDEIRGTAQAVYIPSLSAYLFFMTTYSNVNGQPLHFKLYDASTGLVRPVQEQMLFLSDLHQGSVAMPVPFTYSLTGTTEVASEKVSLEVIPNPFGAQTTFRFTMAQSEEVDIVVTDVCGRRVADFKVEAIAGVNIVPWSTNSTDSGNSLGVGVYVVHLTTSAGVVSRKVLVQR